MKNKIKKIYSYYHNMTATDKAIFLICIVGLAIRLYYIVRTSYTMRQHDTAEIGFGSGHLAYIEYLYNNLHLPDFDPREVWSFYQPPLHHITAAVWLKLIGLLGISFELAVESIQALTTIYSCITVYLSYRILKEFGVRKRALVISFAIICLHPSLILMSGSINNDMLCTMLMTAVILYTVKWYKNQTMKNIIGIALCMGAAMMAKTSGVTVAPAVAFVFIYVFFKNIKNGQWKSYLKQFGVFLLIAVPIGMWWSIYTYARFGMPIGYVMKLPVEETQYIGHYSVWERLFDLDPAQLKYVFETWGDPVYEHNIFLAVLKTSMFGEHNFTHLADYTTRPSVILFWSNVVLCVISVISSIYVLKRKIWHVDKVMKIFLAILYMGILGFYINFCLEYAHTCTMDFRYIVPIMIIGAVMIGLAVNELDKRKSPKKDWIVFFISAVTLFFTVFSVLTYYTVGMATP